MGSPRSGGGAGGGAGARPWRYPRPAARFSNRREGHVRHVRHAHCLRVADPRRSSTDHRCRQRRAVAPRGSDHCRQDRHHRVRDVFAWADDQSTQRGPHAWRLVQRLGGRRRCRHGAGGFRYPDHGLDHPARGVLRRRRLQADVRHAVAPRRESDHLVFRYRRGAHSREASPTPRFSWARCRGAPRCA